MVWEVIFAYVMVVAREDTCLFADRVSCLRATEVALVDRGSLGSDPDTHAHTHTHTHTNHPLLFSCFLRRSSYVFGLLDGWTRSFNRVGDKDGKGGSVRACMYATGGRKAGLGLTIAPRLLASPSSSTKLPRTFLSRLAHAIGFAERVLRSHDTGDFTLSHHIVHGGL